MELDLNAMSTISKMEDGTKDETETITDKEMDSTDNLNADEKACEDTDTATTELEPPVNAYPDKAVPNDIEEPSRQPLRSPEVEVEEKLEALGSPTPSSGEEKVEEEESSEAELSGKEASDDSESYKGEGEESDDLEHEDIIEHSNLCPETPLEQRKSERLKRDPLDIGGEDLGVAGELGEGEEEDGRARFNLRKRTHLASTENNYVTEDEVDQEFDSPEADVFEGKTVKLNLSKKNYKRQRPYTNEAVKAAVKMVQSKRMSILEASRSFGIPRTSLHNFVRLYKRGRRTGVKTISPGLSSEEEMEMVVLVQKLSRCGKRYSHNELRFLVQYYLVSNDRPVFKSGTLPTMGWIAGLVDRHPELTKAKSKKNTKVAPEDVEEWHENISDYLLNDWNIDIEDMFSSENCSRIFCFNAFKMLINGPGESSEGKPSPTKKEAGVEEEKYDQEASIILGMCADGDFVSPYIVFSEENKSVSLQHNSSYLRTHYNRTGRVDAEVAMRVVKEFNRELLKRQIPKPVIFFVNDKQDMAHFSVIEYCWENQICIVCLPPKTARTMTPFEVNIWPKMRAAFSSVWKSAPKNHESKINASQFPSLLMQAWETAKLPKYPIRGFVKSGLIPFNVTNILKEAPEFQETDYVASEPKENSLPKDFSLIEERSRGKIEGIQMCLEAIESFIPPDVLPVWNQREPDYRGRCELAFKLWRSVSLLLKAGCAMASIQQMADGFFNPFDSDFSSTSNFFQKPQPSNSRAGTPPMSPTAPQSFVAEQPIIRKRKLNKSIYSQSTTETNGGDFEDSPQKRCKSGEDDFEDNNRKDKSFTKLKKAMQAFCTLSHQRKC